MELTKINEQALTLDEHETLTVKGIMEMQEACEKYLKDWKVGMLKMMQEKGIKKLENEHLCITYIDETYRETFDSKEFRQEHEELYNDYVRISTVKPSVRIKVKDAD